MEKSVDYAEAYSVLCNQHFVQMFFKGLGIQACMSEPYARDGGVKDPLVALRFPFKVITQRCYGRGDAAALRGPP
ncbi:hypothetical protein MRX96_055301 [Rhipicephalus microplus]